MKVLVTGVGGQLGYDIMQELSRRGISAVGSDILPASPHFSSYIPLDITKEADVMAAVSSLAPDAVIHCAAWTAVDAAEDEENRDTVLRVNVTGTENLARAAKAAGAKMMYISTDYVFDGQGDEPWQPDCKSFAPQNVYGESKLLGEKAVESALSDYFIVRIAWVFGQNGKNFIKTMLSLGKKYDTLRVVCDQVGTPTYTYDLARLLVDMIETDKYGYYHATNEGGFISWYEFACAIFKAADMPVTVTPVTTAEYGESKALRPYNSRLDKSKLQECGFTPLPTWQDALRRYLEEIHYGTD